MTTVFQNLRTGYRVANQTSEQLLYFLMSRQRARVQNLIVSLPGLFRTALVIRLVLLKVKVETGQVVVTVFVPVSERPNFPEADATCLPQFQQNSIPSYNYTDYTNDKN